MAGLAESSSLLWRLRRKIVSTDEAPAVSLVSVAFAANRYFLVLRGDISAVVGSSFNPHRDIPTSRLKVWLEVGGLRARESSSTYGADRDTWEALMQWEGVEPAPDLRVILELDGKGCEYVLALVE